MNWPDFYKKKSPERLATPQELAEYGGTPTDPMTETQILALIEEQMSDELTHAAEEGAAKAKVRAMRELAAMLGPDDDKEVASAGGEADGENDEDLRRVHPGTKGGEGTLGDSSEAERVAAAFFGEEQDEEENKASEVRKGTEEAKKEKATAKVKVKKLQVAEAEPKAVPEEAERIEKETPEQ